jgi:hypothetical protein
MRTAVRTLRFYAGRSQQEDAYEQFPQERADPRSAGIYRLVDPMTGTSTGAAAASTASPAPDQR